MSSVADAPVLVWACSLISALKVLAQDVDVRAGTGLGRHPAIVRPPCSSGLLVRLSHRPTSRCLLGIGTWQMQLFAGGSRFTVIPFHPRLRWPSLCAGLRLVPSFAAANMSALNSRWGLLNMCIHQHERT